MVVRTSTLDGPLGEAVTIANSGTVGDAFNSVTATAPTYSDLGGGVAMRITETAASSFTQWNAATGDRAFALRGYLWLDRAPGATITVLWVGGTSSTSVQILVNSAGALRGQTGGDYANFFAPSAAVPFSQWVRVEMYGDVGTGVADGWARVAYYLGHDLTPVADSGVVTGLRLRGDTQSIAATRVGKNSTAAITGNVLLDDVAFRSGADAVGGFIGPSVAANTPPTITLTPSSPTVEAWDSVTLTATATDADGAIASTAITQTSGTPVTLTGSGSTRAFIAPPSMTDQELTFQATATDDDNATSTATTTVTVTAATEAVRVAGAWAPARFYTRQGGVWV